MDINIVQTYNRAIEIADKFNFTLVDSDKYFELFSKNKITVKFNTIYECFAFLNGYKMCYNDLEPNNGEEFTWQF